MISPTSFAYQLGIVLFSPRLHHLGSRVSGTYVHYPNETVVTSTDTIKSKLFSSSNLSRYLTPRSEFHYVTYRPLIVFTNPTLQEAYLTLVAAFPYARVVVAATGVIYFMGICGMMQKHEVLL